MKNFAYLFILFSLSVQADSAYRCIQANGQTAFSDKPCSSGSTVEQVDVKRTTWQERLEAKLDHKVRSFEMSADKGDTVVSFNFYSNRDLKNILKLSHNLSGQNVNLAKLEKHIGNDGGRAVVRITNKKSKFFADKIRTSDRPIFERKDLEIRKTLRTKKASLFAVYHKELERNPGLKGKVLFNFGISPEGLVFDTKINSNTQDPLFEHKLLDVISRFDFGAKQVTTKYVEWSIEFSRDDNS